MATRDKRRSFTPEQKLFIVIEQGGTCPKCCKKLQNGTVQFHHKKFWGRGGKTQVDNAEALCPNCHDELEELERTGRMQPFVLLYVGQTVCVLVRRRQHATMENKPPSLTAVACACFRGHIDDRDIDIDVLGVVDSVVAHRLGLGDDVDMKTLMNAAEFAFFASSSASTALTNRVPAGYEGAFLTSARGDGGGEEEEDDDDVPHVRDPCHHAMCSVVCNQRHASYQVPLLGRLGESEEERCSRWRRRPPSLLACLACSGVTV